MRSIVRNVVGLCIASALNSQAMAALTSINTGFEQTGAGQSGFTTGLLNGQPASAPAGERWTAGTTTPADVTVSNANPASGQQHVRVNPVAAQAGNFSGLGSPIITTPAGTSMVSKFDFALNGVDDLVGSSEYDVFLVDHTHARNVVEMRLSFTGEIIVIDNDLPVITTGIRTTGAYQSFEIDVNVGGSTIYKRNGTTFYTSSGTNAANTTVDQFQLLSDNFGNAATEHGDLDNVSLAVVPEPASAGLLAAAGLLLARRRK